MPRTRVKICGITRPQDAILAAELGANYVGLNFFSGPRKISFSVGETILQAIPKSLSSVGLFWLDHPRKSNEAESMLFCLNHLAIQQLYGIFDQLAASSHAFDHPLEKSTVWIPISIAARDAIPKIRHLFDMTKLRPAALLLDTASPTQLGGTGHSFNWNWIAEARAAGELEGLPPIILAGGLNPDNVAEAIRIAKPYAVDVSSGVEIPGKPGIKDPIKMRDFIQAAQNADLT